MDFELLINFLVFDSDSGVTMTVAAWRPRYDDDAMAGSALVFVVMGRLEAAHVGYDRFIGSEVSAAYAHVLEGFSAQPNPSPT